MKDLSPALWLSAALALALAGCSPSRGEDPSAPAEVVTNDSVVVALSNPDESLSALAKTVKPEVWKTLLFTDTAVSGDSSAAKAAAIGLQSVNAMLASLSGATEASTTLAGSVKDLATALNLKTESIETLATKLNSDVKEVDAALRDTLVRKDLNGLQKAVQRALETLGSPGDADTMVFAAWVESVRIGAGAVASQYDPGTSGVLNRGLEARHFLTRSPDATNLKALEVAMNPDQDQAFSRTAGVKIEGLAKALADELRK